MAQKHQLLEGDVISEFPTGKQRMAEVGDIT